MHSERGRDFKPELIFCENYKQSKQSNSGNTNSSNLNIGYISNECNKHNSKTSKLVNENTNLLEKNCHPTYLKCSKKEEYEFNFGRYSKDNFAPGYKTKDSDRVTFESLKIENLNSNISITVNYENRQEKTYPRTSSTTEKDCEFLNHHLKNSKLEENNYCSKKKNENQLKTNLHNHLPANDFEASFKRTSDKVSFIHHANDIQNCDNSESKEDICRNLGTSNNYILRNKNVSKSYDDRSEIKSNNDNCSKNNNVCNIKRNGEHFFDSIIKNEGFSDNQLSCDINIKKTFQLHNENNKNLFNNLDKLNFDYNPLCSDTSSNCFDSFCANYPGISVNSPQYQVDKMQHYAQNNKKGSSNVKTNFHLDNIASMIPPNVIKNEISILPPTLQLSSDANIYQTNLTSNDFNSSDHNLNKYSDVNYSNSYLCRSSKNRFQVSNSFSNSYNNNRSNILGTYNDCSGNCFHKEENKECRIFLGYDTEDIVDIKSDFENNIEIKPHIINKSFGKSSTGIGHLQIKQNNFPLNVEYDETVQKCIPYNISSSKSASRDCSSKIGNSLNMFCTDYKVDQAKTANTSDQLLIPSLSQSTSMPNVSPYVKKPNSKNVENFNNSRIFECYPSFLNENKTNSKQIMLPTTKRFQQRALQYTIQLNGEESQPTFKKRTTNIVKNNDIQSKKNSKFLKKCEKNIETPNYRELLNKAYALKNTITENELNLEIIRRTLKCDVPQNETYNCNRANHFQEIKKNNLQANNVKLFCSIDGENFHPEKVFNFKSIPDSQLLKANKKDTKYINEALPCYLKDIDYVSKNSPIKMLNFGNRESVIKTQYPIDLSVKTVKTFADSTNSKEICGRQDNYVDNFLIPKIDFQPNFSIATTVSKQKLNKQEVTHDILDLSEQKKTVVTDKSDSDVFCKSLKMKSVKNIDVHINITSSTNLKHQNNVQYSNLENQKPGLIPFFGNNSVEVNAEFLDQAVDLTSKNERLQKLIEDENIFNLKTNSKICQNTKSNYTDSCIAKLTPKKELHYFEQFYTTTKLALSENSVNKPNSEEKSRLKSESMIVVHSQKKNSKNTENLCLNNSKKSHATEKKSHQKFSASNISQNIFTTKTVFLKVENVIDNVRENKSDLDSLRIRTKAELKGFDLKGFNQNCGTENEKTTTQSNGSRDQLNLETNKYHEINLTDWTNKCNDFVVQLSCNANEKSCKYNKIELISNFQKTYSNKNRNIDSYRSKQKLFKLAAKINNNLCSSSDEDKPLNKLCKQDATNFVMDYKQGKSIRDEILKNSDTLNIEKKIDNFGNLECEKKNPSKFLKNDIYNYFEEEIQKESIKENIKTFPKINLQRAIDNLSQKTFNGNYFNSNKTDSIHAKVRKRKYADDSHKFLENEQIDYLNYTQHNNTSLNIKTKAEMKFRQKCIDIPKATNFTQNVRKNCRKRKFMSAIKEEETLALVTPKTKINFDKSLIKKNKVQNKEKSLIKKRRIFLKNLEFDRILRNKKMVTRGNFKNSLANFKRKNKNLKNEKRSLSKKFLKVNTKTNLKRITRSSIKNENSTASCNTNIEDKKMKSHKCENNKNNISKFPPGWENEVFEYKKSLKIPLRLISIKGGKEYNSLVPEIKETVNCKVKNDEDDKSNNSNSQVSSKSIIDILHSRAINLNKDPKRMSKSSLYSKAKSEKNYDKVSNDKSKKSSITHFSVFDTEILKARTRRESRMLKTKEYIREIFVGEDRPASAPPDMTIVQIKSDGKKNSFEEKFKQYLEEINADFGVKTRKSRTSDASEKFSNSNSKINVQYSEKTFSEQGLNKSVILTDTIKEIDSKEYVPGSLKIDRPCFVKINKQKKQSKYRKKGSSGFDYIKKKKKLSTSKSNNFFIRKKIFPKYFVKKTESDVCKEIKTWVINKSLGQSYLHKAARLGYLDVIAYCLEILNMDPNPKDNAGYTPLHEACQQGRIDIARLLLRYGANHSQAAHSGIRPLHEASEAGYVEIIRLLLSYGADPLLTTYTGQTPLMLADTKAIEQFILSHIDDIQNNMLFKKPWELLGPWKKYDIDEIGYNELNEVPDCSLDQIQIFKNFSVLSRNLKLKLMETINFNLDESDKKQNIRELVTNKFSADDIEDQFECEESEMPLPPLYILKDEGSDKWLLLNDLCHILKIKSKETLLKQIVSSTSPILGTKELIRELKITDFVEQATCLQLLCAGEKLNVQASKVVLIKYNDQVKNLLGIEKTILNF